MHLVWHLQTTPTSFMSVLSTADHTYSEGLIGPLHLHPGGLGNERHFITLKRRGTFFISRSEIQWQAAKRGDLGPGKALHTGQILPGASLSMCGPSLFLSEAVCLHAWTIWQHSRPKMSQDKKNNQARAVNSTVRVWFSLPFTPYLKAAHKHAITHRIFSFFPHSAW